MSIEKGQPFHSDMEVSELLAQDEQFIEGCINLAKSSFTHGEAPFGSVIAKNGIVIAKSENRVLREKDVTRHAEIVAMLKAKELEGKNGLSNCTLYTICEPCPMCAFMAREMKVGRVVYSLPSPLMGGISKWPIMQDSELPTPKYFSAPPKIAGNILFEKAAAFYREIGWGVILGDKKANPGK